MKRVREANPGDEQRLSEILKKVGSQLPVEQVLGQLAGHAQLGDGTSADTKARPVEPSIDLTIPEQRQPVNDAAAPQVQT